MFGGQSAEHEVSLQSAKNVIDAINKEKYDLVLIGIDKDGGWHLQNTERFLTHAENPELISLSTASGNLAVVPKKDAQKIMSLSDQQDVGAIDVVFPILHGTCGEDGTIQGLLKLTDIPFVGAGVLGSAIGMDKDVMKRLLREAGIPVAKSLVFTSSSLKGTIDFNTVITEIGLPLFIKPANLGSSVGISKVHNEQEFTAAIDDAFTYDRKILIEEWIEGREIECSVLGNAEPIASLPGEVIPAEKHGFYSYASKYLDEHGAGLEVPANLPEHLIKRVQELAIKAFKVLCCEGMARVDGFLTPGEEVIINEINTIPGFTRISMYPKLWEVSGISYTELIDRLIQLALERHDQEKKLSTRYF